MLNNCEEQRMARAIWMLLVVKKSQTYLRIGFNYKSRAWIVFLGKTSHWDNLEALKVENIIGTTRTGLTEQLAAIFYTKWKVAGAQ